MSSYIYAIRTAAMFFPVIALLLTLPFVLYKYRKYGSIHTLYFVCVYLFIFYILCVYCLIILPLPDVQTVAGWTGSTYNLVPFDYVSDVLAYSSASIHNPLSWSSLFFSSRWLEPLFNILMTIPFGIFVRYYRRWGWWKTLRYSFYLSMFFELTQLSGLYGIYPRPYRLFDVNDLIGNTSGGMIGYLITPLCTGFLPSRQRIDSVAYINGSIAGYGRRSAAMILDCILLFPFTMFLASHLPFCTPGLLSAVIMTTVLRLSGGYSFGKWLVRLRLADTRTAECPKLLPLFLRELLIYGWFADFLVNGKLLYALVKNNLLLQRAFLLLQICTWLVLLYDLLHSRHRADKQMWYEEFLHIANVPVPQAVRTPRPVMKWGWKDAAAVLLTFAVSAAVYILFPSLLSSPAWLLYVLNPLYSFAAGCFWGRRICTSFEVPFVSVLLFTPAALLIYPHSRILFLPVYMMTAFIGMYIAGRKGDNVHES